MIHKRAILPWFVVFVCALSAIAGEKISPTIVSAKTVMVIARQGSKGGGKNEPNATRAKSQVEKALQKWGKYQVVDSQEKADLVLIVTEGHEGTYGEMYGGNVSGLQYAAKDVLTDTLSIYKSGEVDESKDPLWTAKETGDDFSWPAERVAKKFRKEVEKAPK